MVAAANGGLNLPVMLMPTHSLVNDSYLMTDLCEVISNPRSMSVDSK